MLIFNIIKQKYGNIIPFIRKAVTMETLLVVAKYIFLGIFVFLGATVITKSVGKFAEKSKKKDKDD